MLAQDNRSEESLLPRYSENRAEAVIRATLRENPVCTHRMLIDAVKAYRGERHLELVAMGVSSPTFLDVHWILNCMIVCGSVVEPVKNSYALAEGV